MVVRTPAPPADPDIRVPRAIREAAARAEAAQKTAYGTAEPAVVAPPEGEPSPPATPPNGAPPAPAVGDPSPTPTPPPPQEPPKPTDWEAKYKTDAGRWEAERKRNREAFETMNGRMQELERQLVVHAPTPVAPAAKSVVTPEELQDYGEDLIGLMRRVAGAEADQRLLKVNGELAQTRAQVGVAQNRTMHQQMDALYPQWQEVNAYQPFIDWVMLPDPYSGVRRQSLMQEAWNAGDARRVFAFIQGFLAEEAALNPTGAGQRQPASAPVAPPPSGAPAAAPPLTLQDLAAPGGARPVATQPTEKPMYTAEDISKFFTDCASGKWRHREAERAAIEADIFRAQHEGRVIVSRRFTPPPPPTGFTR